MCTVILLRRPGNEWPLLIGHNRDESPDRACERPGMHWSATPQIIGGKDIKSNGSWLGVNVATNIVSIAVNYAGTVGSPGEKSRGQLVLDSLKKASARDSTAFLARINASDYQGFYLLVADKNEAFLVEGNGREIITHPILEGINLMTPRGLNNPDCPRFQANIEKVRNAIVPNPPNHWEEWVNRLSDMIVVDAGKKVETVSSSLIAFGSDDSISLHYAPGKPGIVSYQAIELTRNRVVATDEIVKR